MKKELGTWLLNATDILRSSDYATAGFSSLRIGCGAAEHVQAPQLLEADKRPTHFPGFRTLSRSTLTDIRVSSGDFLRRRCQWPV